MGFSKNVCGQKVIEHANYIVGSLPSVDCFINKVVDLYFIGHSEFENNVF